MSGTLQGEVPEDEQLLLRAIAEQRSVSQRERQRIYRRQQQRDAITQLLLMTAEARSRHIDSASLDARGEQELRQAATQVTAAARQMVLGADTESRQRATEHTAKNTPP